MAAARLTVPHIRELGIRATDARIARGEVRREQVAEIGPGGKVVGLTKADRVQNQVVRCFRRGEITARQFRAGERLGRAADLVGTDVRSSLNFDGGGGDLHTAMLIRGGTAHDAVIAVRHALNHVGPRLAPVVCWVVIHGRPASDWARQAKKPVRDGIAALRLGLDALADHYGL